MTAVTQRLLHLRRPHHLLSLHRFFSSGIPPVEPGSEPESRPQPLFSSSFSEVRATLQREPASHNRPRQPPSASRPPSKSSFFEEIRRNLAEYRSGSAPSPPASTSRRYDDLSVKAPAGGRSFESVMESIALLRTNLSPSKNRSDSRGAISDRMSLSRFRESLNLKPGENVRESDDFGLSSLFGKGKIGGEGDNVDSNSWATRTGLVKMYDHSELGRKLKMLRPEKKKGKWFSLPELNERLAKLKEMEEQASQESVGGVSWKELRETMVKLVHSEEEKKKTKTMQRLYDLAHLGTPAYELSDPKDHLVEKYFHPDNMSSAEKLKSELKKVRDEFKMSESDCGSARVQVAQLTTKIKHLSSVLHKKDKHSRRGLQAMVQRRKKLLKYLRRTDWDSYCLVLSKLGLRDSPDFRT